MACCWGIYSITSRLNPRIISLSPTVACCVRVLPDFITLGVRIYHIYRRTSWLGSWNLPAELLSSSLDLVYIFVYSFCLSIWFLFLVKHQCWPSCSCLVFLSSYSYRHATETTHGSLSGHLTNEIKKKKHFQSSCFVRVPLFSSNYLKKQVLK